MRRLVLTIAVVAALVASAAGGQILWGTVASASAAAGDTIMWGT